MLRVIILSLLMQASVLGSQVVEIAGQYDVISYIAGKVSKKQSFSADFVATISNNSWDIVATNTEYPDLWEQLVYDGTNTYSLMPYELHYRPDPGIKFFGAVTPSWRYNMTKFSDLDMFLPWLVFALSPSNATADMPRPWGYIYSSLAGYGYRWSSSPSNDGKFLKSFKVVRDTSLDLDQKSEFLRPGFAYPQTLEELENQRVNLESRMRVPNGFLEATYSVGKWLTTNQWTIPGEVDFLRNVFGGGSVSYPAENIKLKVNRVNFRTAVISPPELKDSALIRDFRYTRRENNRMYRYAEYIQSGEWRSGNDPAIKAKQEYYLKHGRKFGDFGFWANFLDSKRKSDVIWIWAALISVQVVAMTMVILKIKNKKWS